MFLNKCMLKQVLSRNAQIRIMYKETTKVKYFELKYLYYYLERNKYITGYTIINYHPKVDINSINNAILFEPVVYCSSIREQENNNELSSKFTPDKHHLLLFNFSEYLPKPEINTYFYKLHKDITNNNAGYSVMAYSNSFLSLSCLHGHYYSKITRY